MARNMRSYCFFAAICLIEFASCSIVDVVDYWPEVKGDLTKVKWSHATNSQERLKQVLSGDEDVMMIEADVSLGWLFDFDRGSNPKIPIMAHPPDVRSDLSLEEFLDRVIAATNGKPGLKRGIKLDFKSTEVAEEGLKMVRSKLNESLLQMRFPVWLNADIAVGPTKPPSLPVNPDAFLQLCHENAPGATLSIGYKTSTDIPSDQYLYSWQMVEDMIAILKRNQLLVTGKQVTYPLRAIFLKDSMEQAQWLLDKTTEAGAKATVTIWGTDPLTDEQLSGLNTFIDKIGRDRIYADTIALSPGMVLGFIWKIAGLFPKIAKAFYFIV